MKPDRKLPRSQSQKFKIYHCIDGLQRYQERASNFDSIDRQYHDVFHDLETSFEVGVPMAVQLPYGVGWMIGSFVIAELSGVGNEGAIYGLVTMVGNLAAPFAQALTLLIGQPLNLTTAHVQADDESIPTDLTYPVLITNIMTILSWGFLVFLQPQKAETQALLRTGGGAAKSVAASLSRTCSWRLSGRC
ncbi:uncharacterized protein CCR75_005091 [Bremia lactucae]|uniref:Uncharacterized protein n=1 Tax=Bremia lactucae TaxID=4779 RepID=A0A976ILX0_BRELC|nr:hypothetical protein CCR75_005091 [Bremia lactucae]